MTGEAQPEAGWNASSPGDRAVSSATSTRPPSDWLIEETERGRTSARRTVEQGHKGDRVFENPVTAAGRVALDAVSRHMQIVASLGDCSLLTLATLAAVSLLTVFGKPSHVRSVDHAKPTHERAHDRASRTKS